MHNTDNTKGLSIVICCHNSIKRLPETLVKLAKCTMNYPWEVILVDNASTDSTSELAHDFIDKLPIRVVQEPQSGLSYARHRGLREASFPYLGFIDDDNHVPDNWCESVVDIFDQYPDVAACGGPISEVCEVTPPEWFEKFKGNYTIWAPHKEARMVDHPLCGAGLAIRKAAWKQLLEDGFESLLSDRKGKALSSGGDFELGYALLLAGWKLYYEPKLHIRHFIPEERLNWDYLCRLNEGFGKQSVILDCYKSALTKNKLPSLKEAIKVTRKNMLRQLPSKLLNKEGDEGYLLWLSQKGRLDSLKVLNEWPRIVSHSKHHETIHS